MFRYIPALILLIAGIGAGAGIHGYRSYQSGSESASSIHAEAKISDAPQSLPIFAGRVVTQCRAKGTSGKLAMVAEQVARIAQETFSTREQQETFILMVCIESRFDNSARSKVGAIGYTQLMPTLIPQFALACGLGKVAATDAQDGEINLRLGACVLKQLLDTFDGNVALALSGYDSGPNSPTTKKLSKLIPGHPETMGYISTFYQLKESMLVPREMK